MRAMILNKEYNSFTISHISKKESDYIDYFLKTNLTSKNSTLMLLDVVI